MIVITEAETATEANKRADKAMRNAAYFKGQMQTARDERNRLTGAGFWTRLWWLFDGVSLRTPWTL